MSLKSDLIRRVARKNPSLGETVVAQVMNIFFLAILQHVRDECRVELRGFGSFSARSYVLKNSNAALSKTKYRRMYFRPSEKLVRAVNAHHSKNQ